jgi:hypothetical protein
MSTQGATLRRGTIELPIWPVAVLVVVALAAAIGMTALGNAGQMRFVTSVSDSERLANSSAAIREQGATLPVIVGISHVSPSLHSVDYATTGYVGISHVSPSLHSVDYATTNYVGISHVAPRSVGYAGSAEGTGPTTNPCPLACQEARR